MPSVRVSRGGLAGRGSGVSRGRDVPPTLTFGAGEGAAVPALLLPLDRSPCTAAVKTGFDDPFGGHFASVKTGFEGAPGWDVRPLQNRF
jgi:hypothetical protein